ncbi:hypothetical protein HYE68_009962 [Fusarium pseudograminearum]|nr:hypothetical protein HYE68_009962 [Fusarium pseudograminearum]
MPQLLTAGGLSCRYNPYAREDQTTQETQFQQQSEALRNASDLARILAIDDDIERLYQARDALVDRVGPSDLVPTLSNSEAQRFNGNGRRTRPTWAMVRELVRQKRGANKKVLDLIKRCESLEGSTSTFITENSAIKVEQYLKEKEQAQQDLRLAQSEIRMLRFATKLDGVIGDQDMAEGEETP